MPQGIGIAKEAGGEVTLEDLEDYWRRNKTAEKSFVNFETALLRLGKDFHGKGKPVAFKVKG